MKTQMGVAIEKVFFGGGVVLMGVGFFIEICGMRWGVEKCP